METPKEQMVQRFVLDHRPCIGDSEDDDACKAKMGHSEAGAFVYHSEYAVLLERVRQLEEALGEFGEHKQWCQLLTRKPGTPCTCGLRAALKGEQAK